MICVCIQLIRVVQHNIVKRLYSNQKIINKIQPVQKKKKERNVATFRSFNGLSEVKIILKTPGLMITQTKAFSVSLKSELPDLVTFILQKTLLTGLDGRAEAVLACVGRGRWRCVCSKRQGFSQPLFFTLCRPCHMCTIAGFMSLRFPELARLPQSHPPAVLGFNQNLTSDLCQVLALKVRKRLGTIRQGLHKNK